MELKPTPVTTTYTNRAKVGDGKSVRVTVPQSTTITRGNFYLLDGYLGVATQDVVTLAGETAPLVLQIEEAEYETNQILATDAMAVGADIYWDATNSRFTELATGNRYAGRISVAKDANNVIWFKLVDQTSDTMRQAAAQADSVAADVATLTNDFNALLAKLRAAGIIAQ